MSNLEGGDAMMSKIKDFFRNNKRKIISLALVLLILIAISVASLFILRAFGVLYFVDDGIHLNDDLFDDFTAEYTCDCDRERLLDALACFSDKELDETFANLDKIEVCCRFCDKKYYFTRKDIEKNRK